MVQAQSLVEEKDKLKTENPIAFAEWAEEKPDEFAAYAAVKAGAGASAANGTAPRAASNGAAPQDVQSRATQQFARLQDHPEAFDRLREKATREPYPMTEAGLMQLTSDVDALIGEVAADSQRESKEAKRRSGAASRRKQRRGPPQASGATRTARSREKEVRDTTDPAELFRMAGRDAAARARSG